MANLLAYLMSLIRLTHRWKIGSWQIYIAANSVGSFFCDSANQSWHFLLSSLHVLGCPGRMALIVIFNSHNALISFWSSTFYLKKQHLRIEVSMANFIPDLCFKDLKCERWVQYKIIALATQKVCLGKWHVWFGINAGTVGLNLYKGKETLYIFLEVDSTIMFHKMKYRCIFSIQFHWLYHYGEYSKNPGYNLSIR